MIQEVPTFGFRHFYFLSVMVVDGIVAVVRDYPVLFQLFAISNSIINGHKGLAHAQNCLKSAETVRAVQKCPENQREWEEAAQRKKCLEIQKYDNCTNVEYHCLVNEFRNKTIEVCTSPRHLQGYCPHYSSAGTDNTIAVRNDYTKKCVEYSYPCNCSSGYPSTEAYKWQCCYNGTNNNSRGIQNNTDLDQHSDRFMALWIFLGLLGLLGIVYFGCVIYGICRKKPLPEVLCVWRYISCKSLICACLSSDPRKDEHERNPMLTGSNTQETIIHEPPLDTKPAKEDNSGLERTAALSAKEGSSNSDKPASQLTPETNNPNSRTSEVNDPKPEAIASQSPKAANSNSGASEVDGPEPKATASHLKATLNSGVSQTSTATANLNEKSVTESTTGSQIVQQSDESDLTYPGVKKESTTGSQIVQQSDESDLTYPGVKKETPKIQALDKRVEHLEDLKKELEGKLYPNWIGEDEYLDYKVRSTKQKMQNMKRNSCGGSQMSKIRFDHELKARLDSHRNKVGILEKRLNEMLQRTDDFIRDYGDFENFITKPEQKKSAVKYNVKEKKNAEKSENKLAGSNGINWIGEDAPSDTEHQKDFNTHAKEEEEMPIRMPSSQLLMNPKKAKNTVFKLLDDDNGASPVTEKQSAKDRTRALIKNFENWRLAIREGYSGKNNMEDTLLEIEADTDILNGLFKPTEPENKDGQQKENNVNNMEQTFEELNKMFDELEIKYSH